MYWRTFSGVFPVSLHIDTIRIPCWLDCSISHRMTIFIPTCECGQALRIKSKEPRFFFVSCPSTTKRCADWGANLRIGRNPKENTIPSELRAGELLISVPLHNNAKNTFRFISISRPVFTWLRWCPASTSHFVIVVFFNSETVVNNVASQLWRIRQMN